MPSFLKILIILLIDGTINKVKVMEIRKQIFIYKNSKVENLMFQVFSIIYHKYHEKSFSLLKNISGSFI